MRNVFRIAFDFFCIFGTLNFSLELLSLDGVVAVVVVVVVDADVDVAVVVVAMLVVAVLLLC